MLETRLCNKVEKQKTYSLVGDTETIQVFSTENLIIFLDMSLCEFNQVPIFTSYSFEDDNFVKQFASILVEGATVLALGSQALLERGREFSTTDSGIEWSPPKISELLDSQYSQLYVMHWDKLKFIKKYIKDFGK